MSSNINSVIIHGRLTRDAELSYLSTGTPKLAFSLANNTGYGDYAKVHYFDCEKLGKGSDGLAQYLVKGTEVIIRGELNQNRWVTAEGEKRNKVRIRVVELDFVSKQSKDYEPETDDTKSPFTSALENDDDIPF